MSYPRPGWVNQDASEIWTATQAVMMDALSDAAAELSDVRAIGITNQRETTVLWDRETGSPVCPAIVWQSRQSADVITRWREEGLDELVRVRTGLVLDPYFSASKLRWIFEQQPEIQTRAERGEILFGTIDSWLIWNLSGQHLTDTTNAARTMLCDIRTVAWSDDLLDTFGIPASILPAIVPSIGELARCSERFGSIPICGVAGDQHAALFGQACFRPGQAKNTYGTGSFLLCNTGVNPRQSHAGLLSTPAWGEANRTTYALEGSVLVSGSAIQWLRDGLGIIEKSSDVNVLAGTVPDSAGVTFVPALAGLGAPDWDDRARGTILGLTRGSTKAHIARATLEAIAYQVADVLFAMEADMGGPISELRVDGGAAQSDLLLQMQADFSGVLVRRSGVPESTAMGAAWMAGLGSGFWKNLDELESLWRDDRTFEPGISDDERQQRHTNWRRAVDRSRNWA
jgi:glycerol kinase